jgi:hypothetical protein
VADIALLQFQIGNDAVLQAFAAQKGNIHLVLAFESTAAAQASQTGQTAQAGQCCCSAALLLLGRHDHGFGGKDRGHLQAHHHRYQGGDQRDGEQGLFFLAQGCSQIEQADFVFFWGRHRKVGVGVVHVPTLTGAGFSVQPPQCPFGK